MILKIVRGGLILLDNWYHGYPQRVDFGWFQWVPKGDTDEWLALVVHLLTVSSILPCLFKGAMPVFGSQMITSLELRFPLTFNNRDGF